MCDSKSTESGRKIIHSKSVHVGKANLTLRVRISTRDLASLIPGRNYSRMHKISLSYMDTHNGLLLSSLLLEHSKQFLPCLTKFLMKLQSEILSTETSDFDYTNNYSQVIQYYSYYNIYSIFLDLFLPSPFSFFSAREQKR